MQRFKEILGNKRALTITLVMAFLWSWLFLVDVGNLAKSMLLGFLLMLVAYLVMVAISSLVVIKVSPFVSKQLKKPCVTSIFSILLTWAAVEFLLAWLVSVVWMGREGSWDNIVPFVSLTPTIAITPLRFLTRLFGFFGTSAVVGTGIVLIIASIRNKSWRKLTTFYWAIIVGVNILLWLSFSSATGPNLRATVVSEHLGEPKTIDAKNSQLVVVPEYGLDNYKSDNLQDRVSNTGHEVFITGTKQYGETTGNKNVLIYGSNKQGFMYEHQKSRLIVGGEYIPLSYEVFVRIVAPDLYTDFQVRRAITKGKEQAHPFTISSGIVVGNSACSSIINPGDYRKLTAAGATVLGNSASLEIFRGSRVFALHHDGLAKFMATANARPFLQSANDWKGFAIDHNGNTLVTVQPFGQTDVKVQTNSRKTPYTYLGEWLTILGIGYILALLVQKQLHKSPPKKKKNRSIFCH